jgi:DNA-binding transcriptional MerR regulator
VRLYNRFVLKIGEFSALAQVSIRTLRHYDEVGLLKPMYDEAESGYRHYSVSQLPRLHRILALRDLGFPLDRIGEALDEGVSADALRGMLLLRRVEQEKQVDEETERLNRLKALIHLIDKEGRMTNDVIMKEVEPQWIVSLREHIPAYRVVGQLMANSMACLARSAPGDGNRAAARPRVQGTECGRGGGRLPQAASGGAAAAALLSIIRGDGRQRSSPRRFQPHWRSVYRPAALGIYLRGEAGCSKGIEANVLVEIE